MAPAQAALQRARTLLLRRRSSRPAPWRMAPMPAEVCRARRSLLRRRSRHSACPATADRSTHQPGQRRTRPAILFTAATNPRRGATFPRLSGATSGYATEDAAVIAIRSPGGAAPPPICCRSTTCCQSPRGVARSRRTWFSAALLITECATATDRLLCRSRRCSSSSCWHAARLRRPTACRWPGGDSQRRQPSVYLRHRLFRLGPVAVDALTHGVVVVSRLRFPAASGVRTPHACKSELMPIGWGNALVAAALALAARAATAQPARRRTRPNSLLELGGRSAWQATSFDVWCT